MGFEQEKLRNIGISAHIDSGKTTLTERILFYTNRIHAIHEVKGKDGVGATMDHMELERERGITITSAATNVTWKDHYINIIDTPGHIDFTIEVERALRVLDGAILVLSGVEGVQSQSITVDRQLKRYNVPRLAFVNKCDRMGANPFEVEKQLQAKLGLNTVLMQIPIGLEDKHQGCVDLLTMKAYYFDDGDSQIEMRQAEIPEDLKTLAQQKRELLFDKLSHFSDELTEILLEEKEPDLALVEQIIRESTIALKICPVFIGSAYKNKGIQPLLDAVLKYLPCPSDCQNVALDLNHEEQPIDVQTKDDLPTVALAFKLEDGKYGQITYVRIYQGRLQKGIEIINARTEKKFKIGRLVRMHSNSMEDIEEAGSGDIVALFGIDCASGDTFCSPQIRYSMTSMFIPEPVISLTIKPQDKKAADNMAKALNRFTKEDPTFRTFVDPESNETIVQGMGELHLDIYIERMKREYNAAVETGMPQVAYRESIRKKAEFNYTHKKQSGGAGQFARVAGFIEPLEEKEYEFIDVVKGGVIPSEFIPACDKGFRSAMKKGSLIGFPVIGVKCTVNDGLHHPVDSSDMAFQLAAIGAFRESYMKASPIILEPLMKVVAEGPVEFHGNILGSLNQRRGVIIAASDNGLFCSIECEVPLSEMFGYSTTLRSLTQGKAEFSMEFLRYGKVPENVSEELKKKYAARVSGRA